MTRTSPNFLVIVLDAVRASDFPGGTSPVPGMECLERLMQECWLFPSAVSPDTWTIPSHASLITGMYPWEHGTHGFGSLRVDPSIPRVGQYLQALGYHTLLLSSNGFLNDEFGFTPGFDYAAWGGWWEHRFRIPSTRPSYEFAKGQLQSAGKTASRMDALRLATGSPLQSVTHLLDRFPPVMDLTGLAITKVFSPQVARTMSSCPWVEDTFERQISQLPSEVPFFGLINLLSAHEPYFPLSFEGEFLFDWWRKARVRQDDVRTLDGKWKPSKSELRILRELYRSMVKTLDERIGRFVEILRRFDRWEDTWLFITSDHGQQFGEAGRLYHLYGQSEGLLRIPLWVRPGGGEGRGRVGIGIASLIDIAPTILRASGSAHQIGHFGVDLSRLVTEDRGAPTLALSDGVVWEHSRRWINPNQLRALSKARVIAYRDRWKVICEDGGGTCDCRDLGTGGPEGEVVDGNAPYRQDVRELERAAVSALEQLATKPKRVNKSVEDRLQAWGYV